MVEQNVRNALALSTTTIVITPLLMPGDLSTIPGAHLGEEEAAPARPGEIRVRASDAGWGMKATDIALLNQVCVRVILYVFEVLCIVKKKICSPFCVFMCLVIW